MEYLHDYDYRELLAELDELEKQAVECEAEIDEVMYGDYQMVERTRHEIVFENSLGEQRIITAAYINEAFKHE